MAIIYTYPTKATPNANDLILISDSQDSNKTKQVTIASLPGGSGSGVSSVTSANAAITVANPSTTPVLTSVAYSGGANIGHVPTGSGSSAAVYLDGSGNWSTPSGSGGPGTGTANSIPKWATSSTLGDSNIIDDNSTVTFSKNIVIKGDGTSQPGKLKLRCFDNTTSHHVELLGPVHAGAASYSLQFPNAQSTGTQILQADSSGLLSWIATPTGGGSVSITADNSSTDYVDIQVAPSTITGTGTIMADLNAVNGTSDTTTRFLSKDNTWDIPSYTTGVMGSGNSYLAGLVLAGSATHNDEFLRKDGTWQATASYSEGTWIPSLTFGGGQAVPTLSTASGNYVIIGKYVYANFYVVVQAGTQYSGSLPRISLPVAAASHNGGILMMSNAYTTASQNTSIILGSVVGGMSIVGLKTMDVSGSEVRIQNLASSPLTYYNNAALSGSIIYLKS